jgi:exonuclease III
MMKIVSYNCRILGSKLKKEEVKKLIQAEKPSILMIQETKMREQETLKDLQKIWIKYDGRALSSRGASDGIGTFWKIEEFDLKDQMQTQFWFMVVAP